MSTDIRALASRGVHAWRTGGLKLFRDFAALAGGQIAGKAVTFVAFAILARVLDPAGYGAVEYVVGLSVFFAMVVDGGLGPIGVRRVIKDPSTMDTLAFQIPLARLIIAIVGVPAMALFATTAMKSEAPAWLIWLFALSLFTAPWRQEWLLQAAERMSEAAIAQVVRAVVFAAVIWALVKGQHDLLTVGWAEIASVLAMTLYTIWVQQTRIVPVRFHGSLKGMGEVMKEGWGQGLTNLVWATNQYIALFIAGAMVSGAEVGQLGAVLRLVGSLLIFSNVYHFNLYPAVARATADDPEALKKLMSCSLRVVAWGGIAVALGLTLLAEPVTRIVFGPKLAAAAPLLMVLAWTLPITLASGHARWGLTAAGAQTRVLASQLAGLITIVVLTPVLAHLMGAMGFAIGSIAGVMAVWITSHVFAALHGAQPPPFSLALKPTLLAGAIVAAHLLLAKGALWAAPAGLVAFAVLAPLIDPKLIGDVARLGGSKLHGGAVKA